MPGAGGETRTIYEICAAQGGDEVTVFIVEATDRATRTKNVDAGGIGHGTNVPWGYQPFPNW